jgi:TatD DNase family protein
MRLIDSHCHLYLPEFAADIQDVIQRASAAGVSKFFLPAIDSTVIDAMLELEAAQPDKFFSMMGLHPCSVKKNFKDELEIAEQWLDKRKFVAIGEIGLDFYWDTTYTVEQYEAFEIQMQWALDRQLPIVIHSRNSTDETIQTVAPFAAKGLRGIFHCFGGSESEAKRITDMNFLLGIGGVLTYKKSGLDISLKNIPLEHMVLETDAPYLTPVPYRGKRNESSYLLHIANKLAEVKNCDVEEVAAITSANAERLFGQTIE